MGRRALLLLLSLAAVAAALQAGGVRSSNDPESTTTLPAPLASSSDDSSSKLRNTTPAPRAPFVGALVVHGGYSLLADALENRTSLAAEMRRMLSAGHKLTLLAPSDAAIIARLGASAGLPRRPGAPDDVLRFHVLRGYYTADDLRASVRRSGEECYDTLWPRGEVTARLDAGGAVEFGGGDGTAAHLFDPDIYIDSGSMSVQGIDAVLFPPQEDRLTAFPNPTPHGGESSFTPEAYPVKWGKEEPPHAASDVAEKAAAACGGGGAGHELHIEPGMLFLRKNLFPGAILPEGTKFAAGNAASPAPRSFLSPAAADAIPFSSKQLDTILRTFGIPRGTKRAGQVAATLRTCEAASPEPHTCATSRDAAAAFAAGALGTTEPRAVVTVVHGEEPASAGARYAVAPNGVARIGGGGEAVVPCHPMPYPYVVHYCHRPAGVVEALRVELLTAAAGGGATAIAVCHANTASWDARYFRMLNATRGEEICHFLPRNYVLWLPAANGRV